MLSTFANPRRFMALSGPLVLVFAVIALAMTPLALWQALFVAPAEQDQGESVRILFVHVPNAWLASFVYAFMGVASFVYFIWRHALADVAAKAAAPLGAGFTLTTLATGSIWGRPDWGAWWVWDARLASVVVLFLLYLGYMALRAAIDDERQSARAAAIFCMVGLVNLPIIKFSVEWWATLHQPAGVFRPSGSTLHPDFLLPLALMAAALFAAFWALVLLRMRSDVLRRRADALMRTHAATA